MKKILTMLLSAMMIFILTACGGTETEKNPAAETSQEKSAPAPSKKFLVAYFSCTGKTKALAETAAEVLQADLYEIKPKVPYTEEDLYHKDEVHRATIEQRNEKFRTPLADRNAPIADYETIILAFPIWWGTEPRIIDTFVEIYDLSGKNVLPICTSISSEIGPITDNLKALSSPSVNWKQGKSFQQNLPSKEELKNYFESLKL